MSIRELRLLPPLAIGRLGDADRPMDNYTVEPDPAKPLGYRLLRPDKTFEVDEARGEIRRRSTPRSVEFSDRGKVRPVAPFIEAWAHTDNGLEPVTFGLLKRHGVDAKGISWSVHVANHKVFRRTQHKNDRVEARIDAITDHKRHELQGKCRHFVNNDTFISFGWVQYIKPTPAYPELRLRFTPARGYVYGSTTSDGKTENDMNVRAVVYDGQKGTWPQYIDPSDETSTVPGGIFAKRADGNTNQSRGYLDDECDGIVELKIGRQSAIARISAGPPAYSPDSFPIRSVMDELEQAMFGPIARPVAKNDIPASLDAAADILRRAVETIRLMNSTVMNANPVNGLPNPANTMPSQDTGDTGRHFEPVMSTAIVDNHALVTLHQSVLTAMQAGTAAWFLDAVRHFEEIGDLSHKGRRKMPALMRGADGRYLALTRRQYDFIRQAAVGAIAPDSMRAGDGKS